MTDNRAAELVADLEAQVVGCLVSVSNIGKSDARIVAKQVAQHLSAHWGGQLLYIPKNHFGKLDERDKEIWAAFNGHNHAELARRYDLTMQQVYKILKQTGTKVRAKSQADLFAS